MCAYVCVCVVVCVSRAHVFVRVLVHTRPLCAYVNVHGLCAWISAQLLKRALLTPLSLVQLDATLADSANVAWAVTQTVCGVLPLLIIYQ